MYFRLPLIFFVDIPFRLLRLAQYYLSPKMSMRKNMKDIIFQLDIPDMECLELSDGMSPSLLRSASLYFFLPLLLSRCLFPNFSLKYWKSKSKTTNSPLHPYTAQKPLQA